MARIAPRQPIPCKGTTKSGRYVIFSLAITVALIVVFFQSCTFAVKLFVILTIYWGGLNVVVIPLLPSHPFRDASMNATGKKKSQRSSIDRPRTLHTVVLLLSVTVVPITAWY